MQNKQNETEKEFKEALSKIRFYDELQKKIDTIIQQFSFLSMMDIAHDKHDEIQNIAEALSTLGTASCFLKEFIKKHASKILGRKEYHNIMQLNYFPYKDQIDIIQADKTKTSLYFIDKISFEYTPLLQKIFLSASGENITIRSEKNTFSLIYENYHAKIF